MALHRRLLDENDRDSVHPDSAPAKKLKTHDTQDSSAVVRRHPMGVRPSGNALTANINLKSACGLFSRLPDELLLQFLELLQIPHLLKLGSTCKALHAFSRSEELWRALFIESSPTSFSWRGTWRSTFLSQPSDREPRINCSHLFSDALHRPFYCAHIPLQPYAEGIPARNAIPRLPDLTFDEFSTSWVDQPFILTSPVKEWPVYRTWSIPNLLSQYSTTKFRAESVDWPLQTYIDYMNSNTDESPLYLFDRSFTEKMSLDPSNSYAPPSCFGPDLLALLADQRPDHRWLIIGPARSGSTFHKDPNATSAWNAVIRGSKYWIMFPSSTSLPPPPGVYVSADQSEVTSPLSIAEWLLGFHAEARATPGCREGVCGEGEVLHVPSGWYHLVLNLEPSIALTQNFVPRARVAAVLQFLRDQKQSVSGFGEDVADPYVLFVERLREHDPELLEQALGELDVLSRKTNRKWEQLTQLGDEDGDGDAGGFSFGFGGDDDDAEVP